MAQINRVEFGGELPHRAWGARAPPPQRMIRRHTLLRRNVTEHARLLLVVSSHAHLDAPPSLKFQKTLTFSAACLACVLGVPLLRVLRAPTSVSSVLNLS